MIGSFSFDFFNLDVGVFRSDTDRIAFLTAEDCDPDEHDRDAIAHTHLDTTRGGSPRLTMVIKPHATEAAIAHECVHLADFAIQVLNIPTRWANSEARAYLVGNAFGKITGMNWKGECDA